MALDSNDHKEAVRLARQWMSLPVGTVLVGFVLLSGIASAASTVVAMAR